MEEQDREEISDSIDKKKGRKGGRFWAGVLVGALIMALAVFRYRKWCSGYHGRRKGKQT